MSRTENCHSDFVQQLLDSYFTFRLNQPREGFIQENKTTQQIQDELAPMYGVAAGDIVDWMLAHDYTTTTEPDGTVAWAVWRMV